MNLDMETRRAIEVVIAHVKFSANFCRDIDERKEIMARRAKSNVFRFHSRECYLRLQFALP